LNIEFRNQIDDVCDDFDRGWAGHNPGTISELLERVDSELRASLFGELVQIDQEHCLKSGETVPYDNYRLHFPEHSDVLDRLAAERMTAKAAVDTKTCDDSAPWPSLPELPMAEKIGAYQLQQKIGEGGMGVVYRAVHAELGRAVALKIVAFPMADAVPRFQAEARTIAGLNHPHIVQIFETGEYQKRPYLALELMQGGSLNDLLKDEVLTPRRAAEVVAQMADAVSAAHKLGVIHRDLKPANVLMDEAGNAKLCDFGLARNLNVDSQTVSGTLLGTPGFMSPEQTTGDTPTPAMDVYGLGSILYAALTGRPPFRGANIPDTIAMVRDSEPVPVRALVPSVPINLESICLKCLQSKPSARYATAAELKDELNAFIEGRPVKARPTGTVEKLLRWCRRKPTIAALSAGLIIALIAGTTGIFVQWQRAETNASAFQAQALRADEQKARAEKEAATASAVKDFTLDILAAAQTSKLGRNATIRNAVYAALDRVEDAFEGRPHIEAAVRTTLGDTLRNLDEENLCIEQYRLALQLSKTAHGETDSDTLHVMDRLAGALRSFADGDDELTEAGTLREFVMNHRIASLGIAHPKTVTVMNNLATVWLTMGKWQKAEQLYQRALEAIGEHPESLPIRYNLALVHAENLQSELAERELRSVLSDAKDFLATSDNPSRNSSADILKWTNTLASVLRDQKKTEAAREIYAQLLGQQRELLGSSHRHTLSTHRRLTRLLVEIGNFEEALPLLQSCLSLHIEKFGLASSVTNAVRSSLVKAFIGLNRVEEAEELLKQAVDIISSERGKDHKYTAEAKAELEDFLKTKSQK